ncbi:hypothetical protein SAMN05216260_11934 [Streptomyces griseoaurantiacus]|uniref:Uncharacterized protein n=1 Tax=Streptomyces griseoaurantiacus TaxID=68213 RepID=A0A1G7U0C2_9ACTN|nr:hypothetical protein SAMN05216260_11934 [Streptomyces jietaisiensis]
MREHRKVTRARPAPPAAALRGAPPPTGLAALQRQAGNAATTRWVQRTENSPDNPLAGHYSRTPVAHPEWGTYQELIQAAGIPQDEADDAWQLLLGGIDSQGEINADAAARTSNRQEQRELRMKNSWYQQFVEMMTKHMELETPTMALWAGGDEVNDYAQQKGHTTLARTRIGRIINVLKLHPDWKLTGPMWSIVSKAFVNLATGPVHIFVRAYNPDSILIRLEVPELWLVQRLNPAVEMIWHPLYTGPDGKTKEIDRDFRLVDNAEYQGRDTCVRVLVQYLRHFHDRGNAKATPAYESTEKLLAANGHKDGI